MAPLLATETLKPRTAEEVREALAWAAAEAEPIDIAGAASKEGLGRPPAAERRLDLSDLDQISLYEPDELVMTAGAGTPIAAIETRLTAERQTLAFEPPDFGPLLGGAAGAATIGGVLACNHSGPRRFKAGAARDHFLGVKGVSGRGEAFVSGGRVVKNVTGYDLCKLLAGSWGTLAAMTEVTVRTVPAPEDGRTVLVLGLDEAAGLAALGQAARGSFEASGLAHLPAAAAARSAVAEVAGAGGPVTAVRIEGPGPSVIARATALGAHLESLGPTATLFDDASKRLWREVRDVAALTGKGDTIVWRLSVAPAEGARVVARIRQGVACEVLYDWAGGLVWLQLAPGAPAHAETVRAAVAETGGHAFVFRAPAEVRAAVAVFEPQPRALAALSRRVKDGFDPRGILNRGRMVAAP